MDSLCNGMLKIIKINFVFSNIRVVSRLILLFLVIAHPKFIPVLALLFKKDYKPWLKGLNGNFLVGEKICSLISDFQYWNHGHRLTLCMSGKDDLHFTEVKLVAI